MRKYLFRLSFLFLLLLIVCVPFKSAIVIEAGNSSKVLAYFQLQKTDGIFHIQYTHSIHLSDVKETYQVLKDGTIQQIELMYEDTSIGMPSYFEEEETFEMLDGKYYIRNMRRVIPSIHMYTAQVVGQHQMIVNDIYFQFTSIVEPGSLITIKERRLALWQMWKGVNIIGR